MPTYLNPGDTRAPSAVRVPTLSALLAVGVLFAAACDSQGPAQLAGQEAALKKGGIDDEPVEAPAKPVKPVKSADPAPEPTPAPAPSTASPTDSATAYRAQLPGGLGGIGNIDLGNVVVWEPPPPPPPPPTPPTTPWTIPTGTRTSVKLDGGERWVKHTVVGIAPPGYTCPPPKGEGWVGGFMFGERQITEQPLDPQGGLFCRYQYNGPESQFSMNGLPTQSVLCGGNTGYTCAARMDGDMWLHPDARVATAQAPGALAEIDARLRAEYLAQMDTPSSRPVVTFPRKVDLAILDSIGDSTPSDVGPLPGSGHGRALAMAAFRVGCSGDLAKCPFNIRQYRAFEPGTVASLSDLAETLVKAVDASQALGNKLVVNISLGLHPRFAWWDRPGENADAPGGVLLPAFAALKSALNYAALRGVIVIASAGNTDGSDANPEDRSDELLYPAAFDGELGWSCDAQRACASMSHRLVYAAGGVTAENGPLPNARFAAHPVPFVAAACNVALDNALPGQASAGELPTYCGTSFGAIGVSTVVASAWAYLPNAADWQVLAAVRGNGLNFVRPSASCSDENCRVRLCATLKNLGANVSCGNLAMSGVSPTSLQEFVASNGIAASWQGVGDQSVTDAACASDVVYSDAQQRNTSSCPDAQYESVLPNSEILVDQPGSPGCRSCSVAYLRIADQEKPYLVGQFPANTTNILSPSLEHDGRSYELGATLAPALVSGNTFAVPLIPGSSSSSSVAKLSYLKHDTAQQQSIVQVDPLPVVR